MKNLLKSVWLTAALFSGVVLAQVNINTASVEELQTLQGIGAKKAADIVAYREAHGAFKSIAELENVKGIGKATVDKLSGEIVVDGGVSTKKAAVESAAEKGAGAADKKDAGDKNTEQKNKKSPESKGAADSTDKTKAKGVRG